MDVEIASGSDLACDAFVRGREDSRICHLPMWGDVVARATGQKSLYLVAREGGRIRGVLPLSYIRSRLFGNRMISQAFGNYGGVLAEDPQTRDALYERATQLATEYDCESIEFRNVEPLPYDLVLREEKITMHLPLAADPEDLWKGFNAKVRNQVRKAQKSGLVADGGGLELLDEFYRVYTIRMKQLGTPCFSRKIMGGVLAAFPDNSRIFVVRMGKLTLGAGLVTSFRGFVEILLAATLVEYNKLCPNNLLYWSILEHYCRVGAGCFDFGRSTVGSSTHRFKKQWGPELIQLHYQYWTPPGRETRILTPDSPKYRRKVEMWKKLPLWMTRLLGPRLSRSLL